MPGLFVLSRENQSLSELDAFEGEEIVILVVVDPATVAASFDSTLQILEQRAHAAAQKLQSQGKQCRVVVEWGERTEVVANALLREKAQLLNRHE